MNSRVNMASFANAIKNHPGSNFLDREQKETSYGQKSGLSEIGRLSVGEFGEKQNREGKTYKAPCSIDYFRVRTIHRMLEKQIREVYGDKPSTLPIFFHTNDLANHCIESLTLRDGSGKKMAYGDGETFHVWNEKKNEYISRNLTDSPNLVCDILDFTRNKANKPDLIDWKHEITLRFCIKDVPAVGYWQFQSGAAKTTIPALQATIDQCFQTFGMFAYLPFVLSVKMVESNTPGFTRKYPVVDIVPAFSFERALQLAEALQSNPEFRTYNLALMDVNSIENIRAIGQGSQTIKLLN